MVTTIKEFKNMNYAYHVGNLKYKTDYLGDKQFHIKNMSFLKDSKTGHFGAGFYFFGKLEDALKYQKIAKRNILMVDFSKYNLYKPNDVEDFVESVIALTDHLNTFTISDITDEFITDLTNDLKYFNINIEKQIVEKITKEYVNDLINQTNPKSDYIITRFLKQLNYEGIDFRNTKYDNFYLGSILYNIKNNTIIPYQVN